MDKEISQEAARELLAALKILSEAIANAEHQLSPKGNGYIGQIARKAIKKAESE